MRSIIPRHVAVALAALATSACSAAAQQAGDQADAVRERNDCRLAARIVRTGHPAPHEAWAWTRIASCPEEGPEAVAAAITATAGATTDATLRPVSDAAVALPHPAVFEASLAVAGSSGATPRARAWALRSALASLQPELSHPTLASLAPPLVDGLRACGVATDVEHPTLIAPLPADARARAAALAARLEADTGTPEIVRAAAFCAIRQLRG